MVTENSTTGRNRVTLSPSSFQVSLDLTRPGLFLSLYSLLLRKGKQSRSRLFVRNAERLLGDYHLAQQTLATAQEKPSRGFVSWLKRRALLRNLSIRVTRLKQDLLSWVSTSLAFFRVEPGLIFESYKPLPHGFSVKF